MQITATTVSNEPKSARSTTPTPLQVTKQQKVSLISNITRHSKKLKEQRDKAALQDSCNINNTIEACKTVATTRASAARKVSSKKSAAVLK